jgi:hypothetical protein
MCIPQKSTSRERPMSVPDHELAQSMAAFFAAMVLIFLIAVTVMTAISRLP